MKHKSARKTAESKQANEANESERPTRSGVINLLANTTRFIGYVSVILLLMMLYRVAWDIWKRPILIDPLNVPKPMEEQGYTGLVAANRIGDEIARIEDAAKKITAEQVRAAPAVAPKFPVTQTIAPTYKVPIDTFNLASSESLPDIEIPETKLSLASLIGLLEEFLHIAPRHVSVALIFASDVDWHEANVTIGAQGCTGAYANKSFTGADEGAPQTPDMERVVISVRMAGESCWTEVMVHSPDEAVISTAREALEMTDPYLLGMYAYAGEHNFKEALRLIQEASEREPTNPLFYNGWGIVLAGQAKRDEAIAKYNQALAVDSKNVDAYNNWGSIFYAKQDYDAAIAKYQEAANLDDNNADAYSNWGNALYAKEDYDGAIAKYQQATALDPKYAYAYNNWGKVLYAKTDYDGAIAKYQKAIALNPKYANAYENWGDALYAKQDCDGGIAKYQQATVLDPTYHAVLELALKTKNQSKCQK